MTKYVKGSSQKKKYKWPINTWMSQILGKCKFKQQWGHLTQIFTKQNWNRLIIDIVGKDM